MNYIILIIVLISLFLMIKSFRTIIKAANRINSLYTYFIISQNEIDEESITFLSRRPDPNDSSGCPKESDLQ